MDNIERFLNAQDNSYYSYQSALEEMRNGRKIGHWIWYVFPQMKGIDHSAKSELYGIADRGEAEAYLQNEMLNNRLHEICEALLLHKGKPVNRIFGSIDAEKVKASMTLFDAISPNDIFARVLDAFFDGERDERTLKLLDSDVKLITGLTFCSDERGITCQGHPVLETLSIHPIGEGMLWIGNSRGPLYYANFYTGKARQLLDENSNLVGFEDRDFDWEKLKSVEHPYDVYHKHVDYGGLGRYDDFRDGICCLCWMLHPDGRYYADEDGYGMEDDDEENIYCIIDKDLRILIPWQPMADGEMGERMREAREKVKK